MLKTRRAMYFELAVLGIAICAFIALSRYLPIVRLVGELQLRVAGMGDWGAIWYPLLFAACNVLLLPGGILSVGGGFFFGLWWGFFLVLLGNSIGAAISFGLSHWFGRRHLKERLSTSPMLQVLDKAVARDAWKIIFLSQ